MTSGASRPIVARGLIVFLALACFGLSGCEFLGGRIHLSASVHYLNSDVPSLATLVVSFEEGQAPVIHAKVRATWSLGNEEFINETRTDQHGKVHLSMEMPDSLAGQEGHVLVEVFHGWKVHNAETSFLVR